jgi:hypothetical protein
MSLETLISRPDVNPFSLVARDQIVARLQDALELADTGNFDAVRELLSELVYRVDAYRLTRSLDEALTARALAS